MARVTKLRRGDIWVVDPRPGVGFEVAKKRPALVVSANPINEISPTVIIVPLSSQMYKILGPERVFMTHGETSLAKNSVALITQIRAIDKTRLTKRVSSISKIKLREIDAGMKVVLGLDEKLT